MPFLAVVGLYGCPTVVNNVETMQRAADHQRGAAWFSAIGRRRTADRKCSA
jgi:NADH-quinone oxidoreductase subunit F